MPIGNAFTILKSVKVKVPYVEEFLSISKPLCIAKYNDDLYVLSESTENTISKINILTKNVEKYVDAVISGETITSLRDMVVDTSGNLYLVSNGSDYSKIVKVDTSKNVTELFPIGRVNSIAIDKDNNLYYGRRLPVCAAAACIGFEDRVIRKINTNGDLLDDYYGDRTDMGVPENLAFDSKGSLYIASEHNYAMNSARYINKITNTQSPSHFVDTVKASNRGLCIDKYDDIYLAKPTAIYKYNSFSKAGSLFSGSSTSTGDINGAATNARFNNMTDILYVDQSSQESIYICDYGSNKIKKLIL